MLSFVIAEEDLPIETSYPFNKVTDVFLLDNYRFFHNFCVARFRHDILFLQPH